VPAFYAELLQAETPAWSEGSYALAAFLVLGSVLHACLRQGETNALHPMRAHALDLLLAAGLLAAAVMPASSVSTPALAVRLLVSFLTLARVIQAFRHWVTRGSAAYLMFMALVVLLACGVGFWWLEPHVHSLADGLWLAFTTAATVGYGDIVPSTAASRIFSVFVVLLGYGVLSLATAAIATSWIETEERRIEREILSDLHRQLGSLHAELKALRAEVRDAGKEADPKDGSDVAGREGHDPRECCRAPDNAGLAQTGHRIHDFASTLHRPGPL
jgi:voltage-gated potassium channel